MTFKNFLKQIKASYVVYAYFECILRKKRTWKLDNSRSFNMEMERHEVCRFCYVIARSDDQTFGPYTYRGEDAVCKFFRSLQKHEEKMSEDTAHKRPLVMTKED